MTQHGTEQHGMEQHGMWQHGGRPQEIGAR